MNNFKYFHRILDNMPVTWCEQVSGSDQLWCSPGFPIGCYVDGGLKGKDECQKSVSGFTSSELVVDAVVVWANLYVKIMYVCSTNVYLVL